MNAPTYTASDFAVAFGDNYVPADGVTEGLLIPLNALHSCAEELGVLSVAANEQLVDFEMVLIRLSRRMELAAELGHGEIVAMAARVRALEAELAAKTAAQAKTEAAE